MRQWPFKDSRGVDGGNTLSLDEGANNTTRRLQGDQLAHLTTGSETRQLNIGRTTTTELAFTNHVVSSA